MISNFDFWILLSSYIVIFKEDLFLRLSIESKIFTVIDISDIEMFSI